MTTPRLLFPGLLLWLSIGFVIPVQAQQWNGSTGSTNPIYRTGNVGLGTSAPVSLLHLEASADDLITLQTNDDQWLYINWLDKSGVRRAWTGLHGNLNTYDFYVENGTDGFRFRNGKVAIGDVASLKAKLHIHAPTGGSSNPGHIQLNGEDASLRIGLANEYSWIQSHGSRPLRINPIGNDVYFALSSNRIGIGTTSTPEKLSVNGRVLANEIIVRTGWADFVFEEDYDLPTLEEVEAHIRARGHLPGIPTAEEVEETGVHVGENQKRLLQKIEEMTLYVIDIKKRLDRVEAENRALRQRLSDLEEE